MTQDIEIPDSMDNCAVAAFLNGEVESGYWLLGEISNVALRFVEAHNPDLATPQSNLSQMLRYLGNQLQTQIVGIEL